MKWLNKPINDENKTKLSHNTVFESARNKFSEANNFPVKLDGI